jgi:hypothetical protein
VRFAPSATRKLSGKARGERLVFGAALFDAPLVRKDLGARREEPQVAGREAQPGVDRRQGMRQRQAAAVDVAQQEPGLRQARVGANRAFRERRRRVGVAAIAQARRG